ncbi:MAG: PAS-domain containing protein [Pseudomonadota bacterium]
MPDLDFVGFSVLASVAFIAASLAFGLMRYLNPDLMAEGARGASESSSASQSFAKTEIEAELERLRSTVAHIPVLLWLQSSDGAISWANRAYLDLADQLHPKNTETWPLSPVFKATSLAHPDTQGARRIAVDSLDGSKNWFDVQALRIGDENLFSAIPIDNTVKAEKSLRSFVQTLTSTFAHLQVGLAIFDKRRQLVLFNPALTDLTTLEPEWLSARPLLAEVLDRLRDKNMLPEPRDYKEWRARLTSLEAAADQGVFEETWALASGKTFRILARPHHDGGIALTLEDVSSELSLTQRFRSEIELSQAVIDGVAPALAVFNESGQLVLASAAYNALFSYNFGEELSAPRIADATDLWQTVFDPSPIWGDMRDLVRTDQPRSSWEDTVLRTSDRHPFRCRFVPLPSSMTLVSFEPGPSGENALNPIIS